MPRRDVRRERPAERLTPDARRRSDGPQGEADPAPEVYSKEGDGAGFRSPRVAVLGFMLESHRWAPPCAEAEFREVWRPAPRRMGDDRGGH